MPDEIDLDELDLEALDRANDRVAGALLRRGKGRQPNSPSSSQDDERDEEEPPTGNVFCSTGKGGGVDPSCSPGQGKGGGFPPDNKVRAYDEGEATRLRGHASEVLAKATPEQLTALKDYTAKHYGPVNMSLRLGTPVHETLTDTVKHLDSLLESVPPLAEPVLVYRGITMGQTDRRAFVARCREAAATGGEIGMPAYTSTTLHPGIASLFAMPPSYAGGERMTFEIRARKGLSVQEHSTNPQEAEFLLPRNARFRVVGVKEVRHDVQSKVAKRTVVQLEQLP